MPGASQAQPELFPGAYEDSHMMDGHPLNEVGWMEPGQDNLHPASLLSGSMTFSDILRSSQTSSILQVAPALQVRYGPKFKIQKSLYCQRWPHD